MKTARHFQRASPSCFRHLPAQNGHSSLEIYIYIYFERVKIIREIFTTIRALSLSDGERELFIEINFTPGGGTKRVSVGRFFRHEFESQRMPTVRFLSRRARENLFRVAKFQSRALCGATRTRGNEVAREEGRRKGTSEAPPPSAALSPK